MKTELYVMQGKNQNPARALKERPNRLVESGPYAPVQRRVYVPPHLEIYGNIRALTLGGSPGIGDSGGFPTSPRGFGGFKRKRD